MPSDPGNTQLATQLAFGSKTQCRDKNKQNWKTGKKRKKNNQALIKFLFV